MQRTSVASKIAGRIEALDYLRGYFILVIVIDHLWRWPNVFEYISGRGELWASAAEGFVIISGLLVGYVRGYKGLKKPLSEISKKLITRGLMLYVWAIITTLLIVTVSWLLTFQSGIAYIPITQFDWSRLVSDTLTLRYTHSLTHFLALYAIFLIISPVLIWLLRRGLWLVGAILSGLLYTLGIIWNIEWMQWQVLFFMPAIAGFYLDVIIAYCSRIPTWLIWTFVSVGIISIVWSALIIMPVEPGSYYSQLFSREPLALARIVLAAIWFVTLAYLFNKGLKWLKRWAGWLLLPLGTYSLTAYIVHCVPLMIIALYIPTSPSLIANSIITLIAILITWVVLKIPGINRVIPR